ncbi:MAG TPA: T9SS type A sorting domain-containing protein, partial [Saprospiraceae bacterium]|nr:T9SS type A sorting domain-containing protein [Saprospiraceae bacterium]
DTPTGNTCNVTILGGINITITGMDNPREYIKIYNSSGSLVYNCHATCDSETIVNLNPGDYTVDIETFTNSWSPICDLNQSVTVVASSAARARLYFTLDSEQTAVVLNWTANRGKSFEVQRAADQVNFETIEEIINNKNTQEFLSFETKDYSPILGKNFYRIKRYFADGSFDFSEIQSIDYQNNLAEVFLFPNPTKSNTFLQMQKYIGKTAKIQCYDIYGQLLFEQNVDAISERAIPLETNQLSSGTYFIKIKVEGFRMITKKLILINE